MRLDPKIYIFVVAILWAASVFASLYWNIFQQDKTAKAEDIKIAKAFVQQILVTRAWNASHAGVYLRVSDSIHPNPFLQAPNRDIETADGTKLTLVNPAFMTRMISDIAKKQGQIQFHLTSLRPLNPRNKPSEWERKALQAFDKSQMEDYHLYHKGNNTSLFSYMAPLITDKSCLQCHAKQGYHEGDVRGGVSVTFPIHKQKSGTLIVSHLLILGIGVLFIAGFGNKIIRLTEHLKRQLRIDGLTQITNRKYFDENFHREWKRSRRIKSSLSLILCDIDHFKLYNDTYGHQAGDRCLKQVAQALRTSVNRPADMVARYGGEEFIVILPETSVEGALTIAGILKTAVEKLQIQHTASITADYVTISLGVSTMTSQGSSENDLIEQADKALYASKLSGRNTVTHSNDL